MNVFCCENVDGGQHYQVLAFVVKTDETVTSLMFEIEVIR